MSQPMTIQDVMDDLRDGYAGVGEVCYTVLAIQRGVSALTKSLAEAGRPDSIQDLTKSDIQQLLGRERRRGLADASLSITQRSLRRLTRYAKENGYTTSDASAGLPSIRVNPKPVTFLDDEQYEHLITVSATDTTLVGRRGLAMWLLLGDTGLRRSELLGLRLTDLDLDARTATVRPETSKVRRPKVVAFSPRTSKAIRAYLRARAEYFDRVGLTGDYLWVGAKREPLPAATGCSRRCVAPSRLRASLRSACTASGTAGEPPPCEPRCRWRGCWPWGGWSSPSQIATRYGQFTVQEDALAAAHAGFAKGGK